MSIFADLILARSESTRAAVSKELFKDADGYLCCMKCGGRREADKVLDGEKHRVMITCECGQRTREENDKRFAEIQRINKASVLREKAMSYRGYWRYVFDADDAPTSKASVIARRYSEKWDDVLRGGHGLMFYGGVGTGKTFYACCIANALIDRLVPVWVISIARLIADMQAGAFDDNGGIMHRLETVPLVILDDIGAERNTDYGREQLGMAVDARVASRLPTVVTTNLSEKAMREDADLGRRRVYDRLLERCTPIQLTGGSRREVKGRENREAMRELLGV